MRFKIDKYEYKPTSLELYLEKALEKGGVILHKPSFNSITWEEPAITRETRIGGFCVTYLRWLSSDLYLDKEYKKREIPLKEFTKYIHNYSKFSEFIDLENADLRVEMVFRNNKLTSLAEIEPQDLATAINSYFNIKSYPEDFKECDPKILSEKCRVRWLKIDRAKKSLLDRQDEINKMDKEETINLIKNIAKEEGVPPSALFYSITAKPGWTSSDELSYAVIDACNIKTSLMNFLRNKNLKCTTKDVINLSVNYSISYRKADKA